MSQNELGRFGQRITSFEDLRGLRAEGYVRDSTLDQRDGFGPTIQKTNEQRFAETYGLVLGERWYTEFVSGRSVDRRKEFQHVLKDALLIATMPSWSTTPAALDVIRTLLLLPPNRAGEHLVRTLSRFSPRRMRVQKLAGMHGILLPI